MLVTEGLKLLKTAPADDKPSKINKSLTKAQSVYIIRKGLEAILKNKGDIDISKYSMGIYEKRVWQMVKNQKRPRY